MFCFAIYGKIERYISNIKHFFWLKWHNFAAEKNI